MDRPPLPTVNIVGDSHLFRLFDAGYSLDLDVNLCLWLQSGATLSHLRYMVDTVTANPVPRHPPVSDVTIIFLGGNDVDNRYANVPAIVQSYVNLFDTLAAFGSQVWVMQQWPIRNSRRIGHEQFSRNITTFNDHLMAQANSFTVWHWGDRLRFNEFFLARDGIHASVVHYPRIMRSLRTATLAALRANNRQEN